MKKIFLIIFLFFVCANSADALNPYLFYIDGELVYLEGETISIGILDGSVQQLNNSYSVLNEGVRTVKFTIRSNEGASVPNTAFLSTADIMGWRFATVEMYSATDDAFTVTLSTDLGAPIFSHTTTAATSGELERIHEMFPVTSTPKLDVTNLAEGEACVVMITLVQ